MWFIIYHIKKFYRLQIVKNNFQDNLNTHQNKEKQEKTQLPQKCNKTFYSNKRYKIKYSD